MSFACGLAAIATAFLAITLGAVLAAQNMPLPGPNAQMKQKPGSGAASYLADGDLNFLEVLPPYPTIGSKQDEADVATLKQWRQPVDSVRWKLAQSDAEQSYNDFKEAFGEEISASRTPLLVHLLDRVEASASSALGQAKQYYHRPRPYQRFQFDHVCGYAQAPAPDGSAMGNSYPSGHTTFGWTAALALAQAAPDRAQAILARAQEYGESRLVCAVHYPSDVQGGELLATATINKIAALPEFKRDLSCAKQEHEVALGSRKQVDAECSALLTEQEKAR